MKREPFRLPKPDYQGLRYQIPGIKAERKPRFAAAPERYPPGTAISINTASATSTAVWTLVVDGPETLELPEGRRETIRLTRRQLPGDDQKAQLWLAPGLNYLPVRIHLSQPNGDFADLSLKSASQQP